MGQALQGSIWVTDMPHDVEIMATPAAVKLKGLLYFS